MLECTILLHKWTTVKWFSIFLIDLTRCDTDQWFIKSFNTRKKKFLSILREVVPDSCVLPLIFGNSRITVSSFQLFLSWLSNEIRFICMHSLRPCICQSRLKAEERPMHLAVFTQGNTLVSLMHCKLALFLIKGKFPVWTFLVSVLPLGASRSITGSFLKGRNDWLLQKKAHTYPLSLCKTFDFRILRTIFFFNKMFWEKGGEKVKCNAGSLKCCFRHFTKCENLLVYKSWHFFRPDNTKVYS